MKQILHIYFLPIAFITLSIYLFFLLLGIVIHDLNDPGLRKGDMPRFCKSTT
jgi:hypothetical protein